MARRKANVTPRVRPAEALKGLPPRMEGGMPDFLSPPTSGGVVEPGEDPTANTGLPDTAGGTVAEQFVQEDPPQEPAEPEPVLGEMMSTRILKNVFQAPVIPDGLMSDDPFPGQTPDDGDRALAQDLSQTRGAPAPDYARASEALVARPAIPETTHHVGGLDSGGRISARAPHPGMPDPVGAERVSAVNYIQRVTVTEAYQFNGRVQSAPQWIDRNWLSFDEASKEETGIGIVLELPGIGICRIGDYIVQQKVLMDDTGYSMNRVAVYSRDDFEKMFLPVVS